MRPVRSELALQVLAAQFSISKDLRHEPPPNGLISVHRNNGAPSVGVTKEVVTALDPNKLKAKATESLDQLTTGNGGKGAHAETATR